mgnify:FL=1
MYNEATATKNSLKNFLIFGSALILGHDNLISRAAGIKKSETNQASQNVPKEFLSKRAINTETQNQYMICPIGLIFIFQKYKLLAQLRLNIKVNETK